MLWQIPDLRLGCKLNRQQGVSGGCGQDFRLLPT
jgi:hypothetical protein